MVWLGVWLTLLDIVAGEASAPSHGVLPATRLPGAEEVRPSVSAGVGQHRRALPALLALQAEAAQLQSQRVPSEPRARPGGRDGLLGKSMRLLPRRVPSLETRAGQTRHGADASTVAELLAALEGPQMRSRSAHSGSDAPGSPGARVAAGLLRLRGGEDAEASAVANAWKLFGQRPPITRSFISLCVAMAVFSSSGAVDLRKLQLSERAVLDKGEWWRLLSNFFYMGDSVKSLFFWLQIKNLWDTINVLEQTKYRWTPGDLVQMMGANMGLLLGLKQCVAKDMTFLGSPLVMAFVYIYSREYKDQVMNFLTLLSVRCGWLPVLQTLQDLVMTGDVRPNVLGMLSGHTYFYTAEERKQMILPKKKKLRDIWRLLRHGEAITDNSGETEEVTAQEEEEAVEEE